MSATADRTLARALRAYAAAFETAYATDDWTPLEPHFTEDATSELNGARVDGRARRARVLPRRRSPCSTAASIRARCG